MEGVKYLIICYFIFFGWIPILAIGKAVSWIVEACKISNKED